jgi:cell division septum initiation protein DivIVA
VAPDALIPIIVNAFKELDAENQELKLRIEQLEAFVGISSGG